jgi:deoxyribodipyrimidine photo-lyase
VRYPFASDRLHRFILDGMRDNAVTLLRSPIVYYPYVEPRADAGKGLLAALAERACVVITDDFPCFFLPRMVEAAARDVDVRLEAIDGNGLLPLSATRRDYPAAVHFRRHLQKTLPSHIGEMPRARGYNVQLVPHAVPRAILKRWPTASDALLAGDAKELERLPIDHTVKVVSMRGGHSAAARAMRRFVRERLARYGEDRSPDASSRLSPYLHFGHMSVHEVLHAVAAREHWTVDRLSSSRVLGARQGWWRMGGGAEAFLDQLVVWRELTYNTCAKRPRDYDRYASLPAWARRSLEAHASDPRPARYTRSALDRAETEDPVWNMAQRALRDDGWYALDGRDPCSYGGYAWTLGRYDRPWPERKVFGVVRTMSSARYSLTSGAR